MKILPTLFLLAAFALTGCARNYVITMNNGSKIVSNGKPKLVNGSYVGKDARGKPIIISAGRVHEIAPASMVREEKGVFNPTPR
mgnify:FL=1